MLYRRTGCPPKPSAKGCALVPSDQPSTLTVCFAIRLGYPPLSSAPIVCPCPLLATLAFRQPPLPSTGSRRARMFVRTRPNDVLRTWFFLRTSKVTILVLVLPLYTEIFISDKILNSWFLVEFQSFIFGQIWADFGNFG